MDRGEISISAAADLASEPQEEQRKRLDLPSKKEALKQAKATGAAVLARDGNYYAHVEPEREAQTERWLSFKDVLWYVADQKVDPAEIVQSVPPYQHAEFDRVSSWHANSWIDWRSNGREEVNKPLLNEGISNLLPDDCLRYGDARSGSQL